MKKLVFLLIGLMIFSAGCSAPASSPETTVPPATLPITVPTTAPTVAEPTETEAETTLPPPVPVVILTEEEQTMLLKIGMAERGNSGCAQCIALVMRTVLNRVNADRFGSSIRSVLFAQDQFTPVMDGTYASAEPNDLCREAWTW